MSSWGALINSLVHKLSHSFNSSYLGGGSHTVLDISQRLCRLCSWDLYSGVLRPQETIAAFQHRLDHRSETEKSAA